MWQWLSKHLSFYDRHYHSWLESPGIYLFRVKHALRANHVPSPMLDIFLRMGWEWEVEIKIKKTWPLTLRRSQSSGGIITFSSENSSTPARQFMVSMHFRMHFVWSLRMRGVWGLQGRWALSWSWRRLEYGKLGLIEASRSPTSFLWLLIREKLNL